MHRSTCEAGGSSDLGVRAGCAVACRMVRLACRAAPDRMTRHPGCYARLQRSFARYLPDSSAAQHRLLLAARSRHGSGGRSAPARTESPDCRGLVCRRLAVRVALLVDKLQPVAGAPTISSSLSNGTPLARRCAEFDCISKANHSEIWCGRRGLDRRWRAVARMARTVHACRVAPVCGASPNVILLVLDTLRADHLSAYGYDRETTPNIDRRRAAESCSSERS